MGYRHSQQSSGTDCVSSKVNNLQPQKGALRPFTILYMKKQLITIFTSLVLLLPISANAFSLKRFITNPFGVKVSSILHPFYLVYKANKFMGSNPTGNIPNYALRSDDTQWKYNYNKNAWEKYSWELEPITPPAIYNPDLPNRPIVPPPIITNPPCQRGGTGITPC